MKKVYPVFLLILGFQMQAQWDSCGVSNGLSNPNIQTIDAFIVHQGRLFAHNTSTGLLYSDNDGNTWLPTNSTFNGAATLLFEADGKLFASTSINGVLGGYQYYSSDNGATWNIDTAGMPRSALNASFPASVIKAEQLGDYIFYQFNIPNAFQWRHKDSSIYHIDSYANINALSGWTIENDTLWGLLNGDIQYLTQAKSTFSPIQGNDLPILASSHIQKSGALMFIGGLDANLDWTLYRSANYGLNWDTVQLQGILGIGAFGLRRGINKLHFQDNVLWLGPQSKGQGSRGEIFYSNDNGSSWNIDSLNLPIDQFGTNAVRVFQGSGNYMFAAMNFKDVYRKAIGNVGLNEKLMSDVSIYPNPSSGLIKVQSSWSIKTLRVFNAQGQLIRETSKPLISLAGEKPAYYQIEVIGNKGERAYTKLLLIP